MIYLLKFGASFVLPPGIFFVLLLLCAGWVWKRGEKRPAAAIAGVVFVFYLLSTSVVSDALVRGLESEYLPPENPSGDVIVMLGGGALLDTPDVDGQGTLCSSPANRLLSVARLYRKLHVPILLSGGQVYADTGAEAWIARRVLIGLGVSEDDILIEPESLNTTQNAKYSAKIINEKGFKQPILVTSAFHMPRAVLCFKKQGIEVTPYPTDYQANLTPREVHYSRLRPESGAISASAVALQERLRTLVTVLFE
ncbi:MAG: YdcF family protein [Schwartzia sp.]|nr:YdcF family protein [Schwartzia sp. (in: firmicutes)]